MSLTVKHLNGDTTFLLTFSPSDRQPLSPPQAEYQRPPGTFTVLVDPWLHSPSIMFHRKFLLSKHTTPACIQNLSELPEPNVVLISQVKPDHCNEATLRQLDSTSPITTILAEPAAAKKIRSMKHFHPSMVHSLRPFSEQKPDSITRFCIPSTHPGGAPGEATISFIPARIDVAGLHNAIGITYRPPSSPYGFVRPLSPNVSNKDSSMHQQQYPSAKLPTTPPDSPVTRTESYTSSIPTSSAPSNSFSAHYHSVSLSSVSSSSSSRRPNYKATEKALSVIYSPHGVDYSLIRPYAASHLVQSAALPLTLLLHSFDRVNNPWWMGGNVAAGFPGGVEIARSLMARCWVSAHDEEKDNTGISVANVTTRKYNLAEVGEMVDGGTKVANLTAGEELVLRP